jgi:hypothetical protein
MSDALALWDGRGKQCECRICTYSRHVQSVMESRDVDKLIELVRELHNATYGMGEDLEYYRCIFNGSWPSAVEVLERTLARVKEVSAQ